jgi:hypothetical protein
LASNKRHIWSPCPIEQIREARDRFHESGDAGEVQTRHQSFFLALAEETEPRFFGPEELALLDRLETKRDNLRTALARSWKPATRKPDSGWPGAFGWFWYRQGYWA